MTRLHASLPALVLISWIASACGPAVQYNPVDPSETFPPRDPSEVTLVGEDDSPGPGYRTIGTVSVQGELSCNMAMTTNKEAAKKIVDDYVATHMDLSDLSAEEVVEAMIENGDLKRAQVCKVLPVYQQIAEKEDVMIAVLQGENIESLLAGAADAGGEALWEIEHEVYKTRKKPAFSGAGTVAPEILITMDSQGKVITLKELEAEEDDAEEEDEEEELTVVTTTEEEDEEEDDEEEDEDDVVAVKTVSTSGKSDEEDEEDEEEDDEADAPKADLDSMDKAEKAAYEAEEAARKAEEAEQAIEDAKQQLSDAQAAQKEAQAEITAAKKALAQAKKDAKTHKSEADKLKKKAKVLAAKQEDEAAKAEAEAKKKAEAEAKKKAEAEAKKKAEAEAKKKAEAEAKKKAEAEKKAAAAKKDDEEEEEEDVAKAQPPDADTLKKAKDIVRGWKKELYECYHKSDAIEDEGKVKLTVRVDDTGFLDTIKLDPWGGTEVRDCVINTIGDLDYPATGSVYEFYLKYKVKPE